MLLDQLSRFGFDPFAEMRRMQNEMNRLFSGYTSAAAQGFPPVNLWVGGESVVVTAELPGVTGDDVDINLQDDMLTLQGRRQPKLGEGDVAWHRRERAYGKFSRTVQLPFRVDPDKVQARLNNGVLEIELHRPPADQPKKITVRSA
jgi:HSP20 family protein